jgi:nucleoside-diphosphate-sugar epimerase
MAKKPLLLVTGASGYLAANLLNFAAEKTGFLNKFSQVVLTDRTLKLERLSEKFKGNTRLIQVNLSQQAHIDKLRTKLKEVLEPEQEIYCVHAARTDDIESDKNLFTLLRELAPTYLIYFSSSAVYGELRDEMTASKPISENEESKPISAYGQSKLEIEQIIQTEFEKHLILRITNPYAKEPKIKSVISVFENEIRKCPYETVSLVLNADKPNQLIRDFIHIDDLSAAIIMSINKAINGTINISTQKGTTLEQVIELLRVKHKKYANIRYEGALHDDIKISLLDNTKLREYFKADFTSIESIVF